MFCVKRNGRYRLHASKLSDGVALPRSDRQAALEGLVQRFSAALEALVLTAPYQWFNFYDYWAFDGDVAEHS